MLKAVMSKNIALLQESCVLDDDMPALSVVFVSFEKGEPNFMSFVDHSIRVFVDENTVDPRLIADGKIPVIETAEEFEVILANCIKGKFFVRYYVAKEIFPRRF